MDIQIPQIIFQIINFSVVTGALGYFLYKPLGKILEERSKKIAAAQKAADESLQEREKLEIEKGKVLLKAEKEAAEIIASARETAKKQKKDILKDAQEEAKGLIEKMQKDWAGERRAQEAQLRDEFNNTVLLVTEKIIGKLDAKTKTKLIDSEVKAILGKI